MRAYELHAALADSMRVGPGTGFGGKEVKILGPDLITMDVVEVRYDPAAEIYLLLTEEAG